VEATLSGYRFHGLEDFALGDQHHRIARFVHADASFSLVPGGTAPLGWDRGRLALTDAQRAEWVAGIEDIEGEGAGDGGLERLLDQFLRAARSSEIAPLLVEVEARVATPYLELGAASLGADASLEEALAAGVASGGHRLLAADEWEWACRGGSSTIFRWGDNWPDGEAWGAGTAFTQHEAPNAFGLSMLSDPYKVECVAEFDGFAGGDGGSAVCGGRPHPETWISFASAYRYPRELAEDAWSEFFESAHVRRAISIP
jgi:hypothetical protein